MQITFPTVTGNDEVFQDCLNALIGPNNESFIDLGCCHASQTGRLKYFKNRRYIDVREMVLNDADEQQYFEKYNILDIVPYANKSYSVAFALDVPEHLTKEDGWKLYNIMEGLANKVICFTSLDAWMMADESDTNPESHKSLWKPEEFDDSWIKIVFPKYHQQLGIGAWFYMKCDNPEVNFERLINELKEKSWAKEMIL